MNWLSAAQLFDLHFSINAFSDNYDSKEKIFLLINSMLSECHDFFLYLIWLT